MKILTTILFLTFFLVGVSAQSKSTPKPATVPDPKPSQTTEEPETLTAEETQLFGKLLLLELTSATCGYDDSKPDCKTITAQLGEVYTKMARSPRLLRLLAARAVSRYDSMKEQTRSAPQASQIADQQNAELLRVIVLQNQRIIELLEILTKKK